MNHPTTRATGTATRLDRLEGRDSHSDRGCRERAATLACREAPAGESDPTRGADDPEESRANGVRPTRAATAYARTPRYRTVMSDEGKPPQRCRKDHSF